MPITRRSFLVGAASALVLAACSSGDDDGSTSRSALTTPTTRPPETPLAKDPFTLGVASGEPASDSVVLWTRLLGAEGDHDVVWRVLDGSTVVATGVATASADDAHTVHVVADGLDPAHEYRYSFTAGDFTSPVGRTVTAPDDAAERLRFAFASCQDWQDGYYTAHAHLAEEDIDLVVFLGDYIYESGIDPKAVRQHDTAEVTDLDGYRSRYALYKTDPNLQAAHARAPWFSIWDDHEVDNNYANDTPEVGAPKVDFHARRAAAYRAWWEHTPTRLPKPDGESLRTYRTLRWGSLVTFVGLDGRQYRDDQPCGRSGDIGAGCDDRERADRTMLGTEQERWVSDELTKSATTWNVVANQTVFKPVETPGGNAVIYNLDQWDGYPAARDRMLEVLSRTSNPVIVTGDIHAASVGDIEKGDAVVASELVGPSLSSAFPGGLGALYEVAAELAGMKMADAEHHGYVVCEVTVDALRADYRLVATVQQPTSTVQTASSWQIDGGTPGVRALA